MAQAADFFVSYTKADRAWAEWIAWELEAAGYTTVLQAWHMPPGSSFVHAMDEALHRTRHTLLILSPAYLGSPMTEAEWRPGFVADPGGIQRRLVPIRIEACRPAGLLADRVFVDLVDLDETTAKRTLLEGVAAALRGHARPTSRPEFPSPAVTTLIDRPRFPTALPTIWNVPFRRNPAFTGREGELAQLAAALQADGMVALTQVLQGSGGVGKTTLAVEYAYRQRTLFDTVWWIRAEEPSTLVGDYANLGVACRVAAAGESDQHLAAKAVRRWLEDHDRWLLILDNAEAPDTELGLDAPLDHAVGLLPQIVHGQVLITTRNTSWEEHAAVAELEVFSPGEAVTFLLARSGSTDERAAAAVAELLGGLPLALEQAGAYVRETRLPLSAYLSRLRQFPAITLTKGSPRDRDPADTVATTWQVSLERVQPVPGAVALLEVCAFLGPEEIPRDLLIERLSAEVEEFTELANDPFALDEASAAVRRYGLVKVSEHALVMHRLLAQVIRDRLDSGRHVSRTASAIRLIRGVFPADPADPGTWPAYAQLLPHALAVTSHARALDIEPDASAWLLTQAGLYLWQRGDLQQAHAMLERALATREAHLGARHPDTAQSLNDLAVVLHDQGAYDQARVLHERALAIRENQLGPDHLDTAQSLNNLGKTLRYQGDLDLAQTAHERALAIRQARLGDHQDTAWSLSDLGLVLFDRGDLDGARALDEQAMPIFETCLGPDHSDTAHCVSRLATTLTRQGSLDRALPLHERSLAIREARRGPDHPDTAHSLTNFGRALAARGDLDRARTMLERAVAIREARLGENNPDTAHALDDLARVLTAQGDLDRARSLLERAVTIRTGSLGPNHHHTLSSMTDLAEVRRRLGQL
jgi:tetratricopeptide (TPR) repeat protein